jgi:hypothetical protein
MLRIQRLGLLGALLLAAWAALLQSTPKDPARTWVLLVGSWGRGCWRCRLRAAHSVSPP